MLKPCLVYSACAAALPARTSSSRRCVPSGRCAYQYSSRADATPRRRHSGAVAIRCSSDSSGRFCQTIKAAILPSFPQGKPVRTAKQARTQIGVASTRTGCRRYRARPVRRSRTVRLGGCSCSCLPFRLFFGSQGDFVADVEQFGVCRASCGIAAAEGEREKIGGGRHIGFA